MSAPSRLVFDSGIIILLFLACMVAGCSSTTRPIPGATADGDNVITILDSKFDPSVITLKTGEEVIWVNQDGISHSIVSDTGSPAAFSSALLPEGEFYRFALTRPGTYTYYCLIHPSMKGTIVVEE